MQSLGSLMKYMDKIVNERKEKSMFNKLKLAVALVDYVDVAKRALWTFVQAFLGVAIVVSDQLVELAFNGDINGLKALLIATMIGALAAALSALKTFTILFVQDMKKRIKEAL